MTKTTAIVIGGGIVGQATARALALKGFSVKVFDRSHRSVGASIRNFGMIWPIGQPEGEMYNRAMKSRTIWKDITGKAGIWCQESGSLHIAYHREEWTVLQESYTAFLNQGRQVELLKSAEVLSKSSAVNPSGLLGGLYCREELILDPREAMLLLPVYLSEKYKISYHWGKCASHIAGQTVYFGNEEQYKADVIFLCTGPDLETFFPEHFAPHGITKCKLQMLRLGAQPNGWRIGPALCGGLSLIHYDSFKVAGSLEILRQRYQREMPEFLKWGIHVMVSQNGKGELTVGDSHEYGSTHDPFDKHLINTLILDYLRRFAQLKDWSVIETWNGIYPINTTGKSRIFFSPEPGIYVINGVGGTGMTSSFALAEELVAKL